MTNSHHSERTNSTRAKRAYSARRLVVIDVAKRTTIGALGAFNDSTVTSSPTASVPGGS